MKKNTSPENSLQEKEKKKSLHNGQIVYFFDEKGEIKKATVLATKDRGLHRKMLPKPFVKVWANPTDEPKHTDLPVDMLPGHLFTEDEMLDILDIDPETVKIVPSEIIDPMIMDPERQGELALKLGIGTMSRVIEDAVMNPRNP